MQLRRLFSDFKNIVDNGLLIEDEEAHYGLRVLRLKEKDSVEIITDLGVIEGVISGISKNDIKIDIENVTPVIKNEPEIEVVLFQGIPDHIEKFELIVQKTTELGITKIVPFTSKYTDAKYKKINIDKKLERIRKIAKEAVRQCKRTFVPQIESLTTFEKACEMAKKLEEVFFFAELPTNDETEKKKQPKQIGLFIGAEGGFGEEEFKQLENRNFRGVHLKGRVLRTETAAITAVGLIQYQFGDYKKAF